MAGGWRVVNQVEVNRALTRLVPEIADEVDDESRTAAETITGRAAASLSGVFSRRLGSGLRAGDSDGPAIVWSGSQVLSGGGTVDGLWPSAEWGSTLYPQLPPRTPGGHLFATIDAMWDQLQDDWAAAAGRAMRRVTR